MMSRSALLRFEALSCVISLALILIGCGEQSSNPPASAGAPAAGQSTAGGATPAFSLAWSEYPSWSVFGVAAEAGLIDTAEGKLGPIEKKWGVDIVLKQADYDTCITMYGSSACDAVCITNMDALNPALSRASVAILPTSTSVGADACLVVGISDIKALRGQKVYGLSKSVSEYAFVRSLEKLGEKESDYQFTNMDPGAAAQAMQTKQAGYNAIMVWNPFVLQTLKTRPDAKVLFDSASIPGEIIDMVVMADDSLKKPGGQAFAHAVIDTYYSVNQLLADPQKGDETLIALGAKFSNLGLEEMKKVVEQTRFYKTADEGINVLENKDLPALMKTITDFCIVHQIVPNAPTMDYPGQRTKGGAQLRFDSGFIKQVKSKG
jgi:NitT/TauT family transport system substrate-binding protein